MSQINKTREIAPFFEDAINQIFLQPSKTAFVMDGPIGVGKSSNFVMYGAYSVSQLVSPIKKGSRMVRESRWAAVRESEQSALDTVQQLLGEAIFNPAVMSNPQSPVKVHGSHPAKVTIEHALQDGTWLQMRIECHGFNNEGAHNRLRTHEFMGAMIFEMQAIPFRIFEVTQERCGRFRTQDLTITKVINGKSYTLSGLTKLAMVLCDLNIPERPHALYDEYYDRADKSTIPYTFITPPPALIHKPADSVSQDVRNKYPVTRYEGEEVVWLPNPAAYNMTRHFEEKDEQGNNIPWSGFNYWMSRLHRTDSEIRRYVEGKPDKVGGAAAVYSNFVKDETMVKSKEIQAGKVVWMGFDPGGHAAVELMQQDTPKSIHIFKEFYFQPEDGVSTRMIFSEFVLPWCREHLQGFTILIVPDPASAWLHKNKSAGQTETALQMIQDEINTEKEKYGSVKYMIKPCLVSNQNTGSRIDSLGYFIDSGNLSVDPSCEWIVDGLAGQYQKKKTKSGIISDIIDKDNPYSHPVEAAQYPVVNILTAIKKGVRNDKVSRSKKRGVRKLARPRR